MDYAPLAAKEPASKCKADDTKRTRYEQAKAEEEILAILIGKTNLTPPGSLQRSALSKAAYALVLFIWTILMSALCYMFYFTIYVWMSKPEQAAGVANLCPQVDALYPAKHQDIFQDLVTGHYDSEDFKAYIIDTVS